MKCEYGCGREAKFSPRKGLRKWCCESACSRCPAVRKLYGSPGSKNPRYGKEVSVETREKISRGNKGKTKGRPKSEEFKKILRDRMKGQNNPQFGKENTKSQKEKKRKTMREKFKNDKEYVKRWIAGMNSKPNKCEIKVMEILDKVCPKKFKYVGNYTKWIGRRNPDFIDEEDKKIIEHFGWVHTEENRGIPTDIHVAERIEYFERYGYKTLIIWEHELNNIDNVSSRIRRFIK